jgi:hypothetical protein
MPPCLSNKSSYVYGVCRESESRRPTFSTDDRPDFCSSTWHTRISYGIQGDAIPFILLNTDVPTNFNVKSMKCIHFHMDVLHGDSSGDVERRKRSRLLARRCFIGISTRRSSREFDSGDTDREISSDPLGVNSAGGGDVLNAASTI